MSVFCYRKLQCFAARESSSRPSNWREVFWDSFPLYIYPAGLPLSVFLKGKEEWLVWIVRWAASKWTSVGAREERIYIVSRPARLWARRSKRAKNWAKYHSVTKKGVHNTHSSNNHSCTKDWSLPSPRTDRNHKRSQGPQSLVVGVFISSAISGTYENRNLSLRYTLMQQRSLVGN